MSRYAAPVGPRIRPAWAGLLLLVLGPGGCAKEPPPAPMRSRIAFSIDRGATFSDIMLIEADGTGAVRLGPDESQNQTPAWRPDGKALVFASEHDLLRGLFRWDGTVTRLTSAPFADEAPSFSPDGSKIAVMSNRDGNWEIYLLEADGGYPRRLTDDPAADIAPAWSPDGKSIAFVSDRSGHEDLYLMHPDGTGVRPLTNDRAWDGRPAWSPDGRKIAWTSGREGALAVFVMEVETGRTRRLTSLDGECDSPTWSPDGKTVAFVCDRDGFREIYVAGADGREARRLTTLRGMIESPNWSPWLPPSP